MQWLSSFGAKPAVPRSSSCPTLCERPSKLTKSVSFHEQVVLLRFKQEPAAPLWYRADEYSVFVTDELARRRHLNIHTTSLLMSSDIAHKEPEPLRVVG